MVKSGDSIGFTIPNLGMRTASPRSPSKCECNNTILFIIYKNEIVGVEQSFTVFLRGKAASRPFKLTLEMEFLLRDKTSNLTGGKCPTLPVGAHEWLERLL